MIISFDIRFNFSAVSGAGVIDFGSWADSGAVASVAEYLYFARHRNRR